MRYRKLPKGTEQISVLGIGTSSIQASSEKEIEKIIAVEALCRLWVGDKRDAGDFSLF